MSGVAGSQHDKSVSFNGQVQRVNINRNGQGSIASQLTTLPTANADTDKLSSRAKPDDKDLNELLSPHTMVKMSKKILELRNVNTEEIHVND